jgi:hypothetical protein
LPNAAPAPEPRRVFAIELFKTLLSAEVAGLAVIGVTGFVVGAVIGFTGAIGVFATGVVIGLTGVTGLTTGGKGLEAIVDLGVVLTAGDAGLTTVAGFVTDVIGLTAAPVDEIGAIGFVVESGALGWFTIDGATLLVGVLWPTGALRLTRCGWNN